MSSRAAATAASTDARRLRTMPSIRSRRTSLKSLVTVPSLALTEALDCLLERDAHAVERLAERPDLVVGRHADRDVQLAKTDPVRSLRELDDRPRQALRRDDGARDREREREQ